MLDIFWPFLAYPAITSDFMYWLLKFVFITNDLPPSGAMSQQSPYLENLPCIVDPHQTVHVNMYHKICPDCLNEISVCHPQIQYSNKICQTGCRYYWKSHMLLPDWFAHRWIPPASPLPSSPSSLILAIACLACLYLSLYPTSLFKKPMLKLSLSCCSDPVRHSYSNQTLHPLLQVHSSSLKSEAQKNTAHTYSFAVNLFCSF